MSSVRRVLSRLAGSADRQTIARYVAPQIDQGNRSKAFRRVYALLDEGHCNDELVERLAQAFPAHEVALREAYEVEQQAEHRQQQDKAAAAFHPHLWVVTERSRPTQITIVGLTGGVDRYLKHWLPEGIGDEPWAVQQRRVREAVREHRQQGDAVRFFGAIRGYWYRPHLASAFWVSIDGLLHNQDRGAFNEPRVEIGGVPTGIIGESPSRS